MTYYANLLIRSWMKLLLSWVICPLAFDKYHNRRIQRIKTLFSVTKLTEFLRIKRNGSSIKPYDRIPLFRSLTREVFYFYFIILQLFSIWKWEIFLIYQFSYSSDSFWNHWLSFQSDWFSGWLVQKTNYVLI